MVKYICIDMQIIIIYVKRNEIIMKIKPQFLALLVVAVILMTLTPLTSVNANEDQSIDVTKIRGQMTMPIASTVYSFFAVDADGGVWAFGDNITGQLGLGDDKSIYPQTHEQIKPTKIPGLKNIVSVYSKPTLPSGPNNNYESPHHQPYAANTFAIDKDGKVWGWGKNDYGQLGDGTTVDRLTPVQIPNLEGIVNIQPGMNRIYQTVYEQNKINQAYFSFHTALKKDGTVWIWRGKTTIGTEGRTAPGTIRSKEENPYITPQKIEDERIQNIVSIQNGEFYILMLRADGKFFAIDMDSRNYDPNDDNIEGRIIEITKTPEIISPLTSFSNYRIDTVFYWDKEGDVYFYTNGDISANYFYKYTEHLIWSIGGINTSTYPETKDWNYFANSINMWMRDNGDVYFQPDYFYTGFPTKEMVSVLNKNNPYLLKLETEIMKPQSIEMDLGNTNTQPPAPAPSPIVSKKAIPINNPVLVDDNLTKFEAYKIDGNNYFKLRDIAYILNGTKSQFEVGYANGAISLTQGMRYTEVGGEFVIPPDFGKVGYGEEKATLSNDSISLNGQKVSPLAYKINGNNYFKLRDLGELLGFVVDFDGTNVIIKSGGQLPVKDITVTTTGGERWNPVDGNMDWNNYLQAIYEDCEKTYSFSVTCKSDNFINITSGYVEGNPNYKIVIEKAAKDSVTLYFTVTSYKEKDIKPIASPNIVLVESDGTNYRFKISEYKGVLPSANTELGYGQCTWLAGYCMRVKNSQPIQGTYAGLVEISKDNPPKANSIIGSANASGQTNTHMAYITKVTVEEVEGKTIYHVEGVETNVGKKDGTIENWTGKYEITSNGVVTWSGIGKSGRELKYIKY